MGQCELYIDSTSITDPNYMPLDTVMLSGESFILMQEIVYSETIFYKFELEGDSIKITRKTKFDTTNLYVRGDFKINEFQPGQLSIYSNHHSQHKFNMIYYKSKMGLLVIIPVGSVIEEANKCMFETMPELSIQIDKIIQWRKEIDSVD
jgi:hypothetical protein